MHVSRARRVQVVALGQRPGERESNRRVVGPFRKRASVRVDRGVRAARIAGRCPPATVAPCAAAGRARARASRHRSRRSRRRRRAGRPPDSPIRAHNERRRRPHARTPRAHRPRGRRSATRCRDCSRRAHRSRRPTLRGKTPRPRRACSPASAAAMPSAFQARASPGTSSAARRASSSAATGSPRSPRASARRRSASERTSGDTRSSSTIAPAMRAAAAPSPRSIDARTARIRWSVTRMPEGCLPGVRERLGRDFANRREVGGLEMARVRGRRRRAATTASAGRDRLRAPPPRTPRPPPAAPRCRRTRGPIARSSRVDAEVREDRVRRALAVPPADQRDHRHAHRRAARSSPLTSPKGIGSSTTSTTR